MLTKTKTLRGLRMLESSGLSHAETFHHRARPNIADRCKRDNFSQAKHMKTNVESFLCGLGSEPFTPVVKCEAPPDLDAGRKRKFIGWRVQADKPDEFMGFLALGGPETPTSLFDEQLATISHRITCSTIKRSGEELHDLWVRIHRGEGLAVIEPPLA